MTDVAELKEYLREHLFYELMMLRYTLGRIQHVKSQVLWNALFESFGMHARNLYAFLRNERDHRNVIASDFVDQFNCGRENKIAGTMDRLNQQLLHLGRRRHQSGPQKLDTSDAIKVAEWIEKMLKKFSKELKEPYLKDWKPDDADLSEIDVTVLASTTPSQSSHPVAISSRNTSIGRRGVTETRFKKP
jgi:hypothetical protein